MWCTTSGIKVSKWPEAFLRLLVIGKCLALGLGALGGGLHYYSYQNQFVSVVSY